MAYVTDRVIHDADAHVMETPEWIEGFASQRVLEVAHLPQLTQDRSFRFNFEDM